MMIAYFRWEMYRSIKYNILQMEIWFSLSSKSDFNYPRNLICIILKIWFHYLLNLICCEIKFKYITKEFCLLTSSKWRSDLSKLKHPRNDLSELKFKYTSSTKESFLWTSPRQYWEGVGKQISYNRAIPASYLSSHTPRSKRTNLDVSHLYVLLRAGLTQSNWVHLKILLRGTW